MLQFLEKFIAQVWNRVANLRRESQAAVGLALGSLIRDGIVLSQLLRLGEEERTHHIVTFGRTGSGKSSFLRFLAKQDIEERRGFIYFDLHGDTVPVLLRFIAGVERKSGADLAHKLIVLEPGDGKFSVGLNVLESREEQQLFVLVAEFAQVLKQRWGLEKFGARTEELLRNALYLLAVNAYTLLELPLLLTDATFRAACLERCENSEIKEYFEARYNRASDAMQAAYRDAVLNKISAFTVDPAFRHLLGQQRSTFSLTRAIDDSTDPCQFG